MTRMICHLDMDAFFAAVEERDNPRWRGMPIAVGSDPQEGRGRGVVSTANYAARVYGIGSAMPITRAWRLSEEARKAGKPAVVFLPVNGRRYGEISRSVMEIAARYSPTVEQASVDEAYMDFSHYGTWAKAKSAAVKMKREIFKVHQLTCTVGVAPNKMVAKVAANWHKPDGLTVVPGRGVEKFLAPLDIRKLPGIGPKSEVTLKRRGFATVASLQALTEADLYSTLGEWGLDLYDRVHGRSSDELVTQWTAKSIGEQETFDADTLDSRIISKKLADMCASVFRQLKKDGFASYRRVVLTVRFSDFHTVTRSHSLPESARGPDTLRTQLLKMLLPFFDKRENPKRLALRLVGVRVEQLQEKSATV